MAGMDMGVYKGVAACQYINKQTSVIDSLPWGLLVLELSCMFDSMNHCC